MINIIENLKKSAKKNPEKIAVIEEKNKITYFELNSLSKRIGSYLLSEGVFNEPIIVFMDKHIDTLISFFGILYSGNYYSLLNPLLPESRIEQIKNTINSRYVITDNENIEIARKYFSDLNIIDVRDLFEIQIDEKGLNNINNKHIDYDPMYVNFTSGSTGVPKGVVISHRSVIDFISEFTNTFDINSNDIIANQAPFDFDVSVKDIYSTISVGATLLIVPKKYFSNPSTLLDYICDNSVTTMIWAVSALCLITTFHGLKYRVPTTVNKVIFSGEVMPIKHLNEWMDYLKDAKFVNVYGPTEITCNCTYHIVDRNREYEKLPIGKPFKNERVFLLDENDKLIKEKNKSGEICVSGTALGLGYFNNKEQTDSHFMQNPLVKNYIELMYRTGDVGYIDENDDIVFVGRKDFQIKYQGHRIELEEIDNALLKFDEVIRSCTIFDSEKSKLYSFYVGNIDKKELHLKLKEILPVYMIPTKLIQIDEFPLTKNGKIDRKKLMEMK